MHRSIALFARGSSASSVVSKGSCANVMRLQHVTEMPAMIAATSSFRRKKTLHSCLLCVFVLFDELTTRANQEATAASFTIDAIRHEGISWSKMRLHVSLHVAPFARRLFKGSEFEMNWA